MDASEKSPARPQPAARPGALGGLATLRNHTAHRVSSEADDPASNQDFWWIEPGETRALFDVTGCGTINHIWMTTPSRAASGSWYAGSLETTRIRMYWDGSETPAVDAPLGAFFCAPFDTAREFVSTPVVLAPLDGRGFNMYFPMPFAEAARIELVNESASERFRIYFHIDFARYDSPAAVEGQGRFHARYAVTDPLVEGEPVVPLEVTGRGHYAGCVLFLDTGIKANRDGYLEATKERFPDNAYRRHWWEGDDRIYIDGELALRGTGTEDYFGSAWSYASERPFTAPEFGCVMNGYDPRDHGRWCLYRWHISDPIPFRESIRVTLEHGHDNRFLMAPYHTVAYWYQAADARASLHPTPRSRP
jgi:hypothetical protein